MAEPPQPLSPPAIDGREARAVGRVGLRALRRHGRGLPARPLSCPRRPFSGRLPRNPCYILSMYRSFLFASFWFLPHPAAEQA
jgi:hypothetical protein